MDAQSRLDRYEQRTEWPLVTVALTFLGLYITLLGVVTATLASWIVQRVSEEDTAQQAATAAQIEVLREEIRRLAERQGQGGQVEGSG